DDRVAKSGAGIRTEVHDPIRQTGFEKNFEKLGSDGRRIARWLQNDCIAADDGGSRHASHDGARKIPRRDDGAYAERDVAKLVMLAGKLHWRLRAVQAQS